jgi:hypothetical protein
MGEEYVEWDVINCAFVARLQNQGRRKPGFPRLLPTQDTQAPPVSRLEPGEFILRTRGRQIIASRLAESQEGLGDLGADEVASGVVRSGATVAVAKESGLGGETTGLKLLAQDISGTLGRRW